MTEGPPPEPLAELRAGVLAVLPAAVAVAPFALLLGALAAGKGLSVFEVVLMSALVFAGSAQFVAIDIWREPVPWLMLAFTALLINSRHLLLGASLGPKIADFGTRRSLVALFWMVDEVWALAEARARASRLTFPYMAGLGAFLWLNWIAWTGLGASVGTAVADPVAFGFDFAFTAIFIGLLVLLWQGPRSGVAIAVSAAVATFVHLAIEGPWYIAAGGIAGALAGAVLGPAEAPQARGKTE